MGFYFNALDARWHPIDHDRQLTRQQQKQINRRSELIAALMEEMQSSISTSVIRLYAGCLARELTSSDELLVREHARQLAALAPDNKKQAA